MPWVTKQQANTNRRGGWTTVKQKIPLQKNENYQNAVANAQKYAQEAQQANSWKGMLGNMLKATPKAAADVLIGTPFKFGASVAEIPGIVKRRGQTTQREYKIPGLSPFKSYQSDFQNVANDVISGKRGMGSAAWSVAQPVLGGLEMFGIGKGIGRGVKAFRGAPTLSQGIRKAAPEVLDAFVPTTRGINTRVSNRNMAAQLQDPLIQEARKYKSAEEFVKAQERNYLFHGTSKESADAIRKEGFKFDKLGERAKRNNISYGFKSALDSEDIPFVEKKAINLSDDYNYARRYANSLKKSKGRGEILNVKLKEGQKIIDTMSDEYGEIFTKAMKQTSGEGISIGDDFGKFVTRREQLIDDELIKRGYAGYGSKGKESEFKIFNPSSVEVAPSKSQLTDIWNKSQPLQEGVNPLIQEARKYKSAEEFVKAQGTPVYHGTNKEFVTFKPSEKGDFGKGVYFTSLKEDAKGYATLEGKKGSKVIEGYVNLKNPYITDNYNWKNNKMFYDTSGKRVDETALLQSKGYDGVIFEFTGEGLPIKYKGQKEYVVFDPSQIKTKSQLTDIWNKANKSQPLQEARKVELNTGPKQGINKFYPSFLRSGQRTLENQGSTGQVLANTLEDERVAEDLQIGKWKAFVNQFTGQLNDAQKANLTDVLEGKSSPMDSTVAGSSKALRNWLNKVQRTAGEKGLDVGYRENYFPRKYNWSEITKEGRKNEITQHLVDTGQASTRAEAEDFLNDFIFKNSQRKAGNLEYERMFDIPGYERDPEKALTMYAESAGKRLTQVEHFGAKDEVVNSLINKIDKEGGDYKSAQKIFDYVYKGEDKNKFADALLAYNTFTKLSLAFFSNLTQSANTAAKGGIINTIKGAAQALAQGIKAMKGQKYDDIAVLSNSLDEYIGLQESGLSGRFVKGAMYLFQKVENFNRRTAANTGVLRANQLAKVLSKDPQNATAIRQLESLGIKLDDIVKGKLTEQQLLTAANKMTKTTQFKMNALMMPQAWRTPMGKVLTQFKGFSFMQTKFLRDEVIKEAAKGNLAPLTRFLMIAPIASYVTQSARNYINQAKTQADFRKGDLYRKAVGDLPSDIASQMQYANEKKDKWYTTPLVNVKNFSSPFIGPTGSDVLQVASALEQKGNIQDKNETWYKNHPAAQQDPNLDLKRFAVTKIPFIGRRLANTTFGYGPTVAQNAKELARQAIQNNDQNLFNQALEKDPYLKKEDALRAAIGKKVSEMTPTEKKFYEQVKAEARKSKPYYSK